MAFPWIFEAQFEAGTNADWDSEADTDGILDFPHYSELARFPWSNATPYLGAYCARIVPAGGTNDATLTEADINIADTVTSHFRFSVWFSPDFDATADDTFALLELKGAAAVVTGSIGARYVAATDVINMGIGSSATGTVPSQFASFDMSRNTWYTIEATFDIETNGSGTADLFITKEGDAAQTTADASLTSVTNIAVTDGVFGLQDHLATTTGTILLDDFVQDDARVFPRLRFPRDPVFTTSGHAFIGPGSIDGAALLTTGGSNVMRLWDSDIADTNATQSFKVEMDQDRQTSFAGPLKFNKGCYVQLSGTNPRGQVIFQGNTMEHGHVGPLHHSPALMRRWGLVS